MGAMLGFLGGAGINGGQNNADAIFGSADEHDMVSADHALSEHNPGVLPLPPRLRQLLVLAQFGVSGPGWYGPGNGEEAGELWSP